MSEDLLFISAHLPVEKSRQAGHKTAWRNLVWLSERYRVHLIAFRSEGDREEPLGGLHGLCANLHVVDVTRNLRVRGLMGGPQLPLAVGARNSAEVRRQVREWSRRTRFSRVHVEWSQLGQYLNEVDAVPERTLYVHDVLTQWSSRRAVGWLRWLWNLEADRTRRWERRVYGACTRLFVPSAKDGRLISEDAPELAGRIVVLPLHFDFYRPSSQRSYAGPIRLLFWGALGRPENAEAARWLVDHVVPRLRAAKIPFILVLAGSNPPQDIAARRAPDVEVTGFITDPSEQFARAHLAVLPLFQGAGVKVKVLECLAAGLPVLTTGIGSEGISATPDDGLKVLAPEAVEFARSIAQLAEDRARLQRVAEAADAWGQRQGRDYRRVLVEA